MLFKFEFFVGVRNFHSPSERDALRQSLRFESANLGSAKITARNIAAFDYIGINDGHFNRFADSSYFKKQPSQIHRRERTRAACAD